MKVLKISTSGLKNLAKEVTIYFSNSTIENGINKVNNVKGIFGFNGAGKTAFISSIYLYKQIVMNPTFLLQNEVIKKLDKLINYQTKFFNFSIIFEYNGKQVIKHSIKIEKNDVNNTFFISREEISLSNGRTLDDKYISLISKNINEITISSNRGLDKYLPFLTKMDLSYASILHSLLTILISNKNKEKLDVNDEIFIHLYQCINNIDTFLSTENVVSGNGNVEFDELLFNYQNGKNHSVYISDSSVFKKDFEAYSKDCKRLLKFLQLFKPEIKDIFLDKYEVGDTYFVKKIICYDNYKVDLEFESSGIKQLIKLFTYLYHSCIGKTIFIDEIDTNINSIYFTKLIMFFKNYGQGQLIFTTHNIEAMNALKSQTRSIVVLGNDNNLDVWVGRGNRSPSKEYIDGFFVNSPMNIEDFNFINIFLNKE